MNHGEQDVRAGRDGICRTCARAGVVADRSRSGGAAAVHGVPALARLVDGRRIPSIRVPLLTPALSAMWLRIVSGAEYSVARELVLGLTHDLLPQRTFWELASHTPKLSFRAAAASALVSETRSSAFAQALERVVRRLGSHAKA
jgi:hypothetical protein